MASLQGKTSAPALAESALHARLRDKLNLEGVKLWLKPFVEESESTPNDSEILILASRYATELDICESNVVECLYSLQKHALERLAERKTFQSTGLATIRLRFSGFTPDQLNLITESSKRLQIDLSKTNGIDLKEKISNTFNLPVGLKLISNGKVIEDHKLLNEQNVRNGSQVMIISISSDVKNLQEAEGYFKELEDIKASAGFLSEKDGTDGLYSLQVADQTGKSIFLPDNEKRCLSIALALHEKGRFFLKSNKFSKAIVFLLEADNAYSQCQSSILEKVDNYGLLNLDIAWCYLCLQNIAELPQVEARLENCEKVLKRSYGDDMERVLALKGSTGWEAALYVRLHILQGITSYHLGHIEKSRFYINRADEEISRLKISDEVLSQMLNMGYGANESRIALRASYGDINRAVNLVIRKREEEAEAKALEREDLKRRKLQKKLGTCDNGDAVNVQLYKQLKEMGYSPSLISAALRRTNNDISAAVQQMGNPSFESEVITQMFNNISEPSSSSNPNPLQTQMEAAMANLLENVNATDQVVNNPAVAEAVTQLRNLIDGTFSEELLSNVSAITSEEEIQKSKEAYESLSKDTCSEGEYIDLELGDETAYLQEYQKLLESIEK